MPRPLTFTLSAVCVGLIGIAIVLFIKRGRPAPPPLHEDRDSVAQPLPQRVVDGKPALHPPAVAVKPPRLPPVTQRDARPPPDEASLLAQLHELAASNPDLSLRLARDAVKRFPDSPDAPEFEWNVVKALFNMGRLDEAEAEARVMLSRYPDSSFTGDVVHHLLNHPPNPPGVP